MKTKLSLSYIFSYAFLLGALCGCGKSREPEQQHTDTSARRAEAPSSDRTGNLPAAKRQEKTYRVLAAVVGIREADSTLTIDHEKMEGFMQAMTMPYKVADPAIFQKVAVGTEGHFTIGVYDGEGVITAVHVHKK